MNPYALPSMTLVTRCPACVTMFKVAPDQLKVADGWVRCGRCSEVFEASVVPYPDAPVALDQPAAMPLPQTPETPSFSAFSQQGLAEPFVEATDRAPSLTPDFAPSFQEASAPQAVPQRRPPPASGGGSR